jgi:hypothetical protein
MAKECISSVEYRGPWKLVAVLRIFLRQSDNIGLFLEKLIKLGIIAILRMNTEKPICDNILPAQFYVAAHSTCLKDNITIKLRAYSGL